MIRSSLLDKLMKLAVLVIVIVELAAVQYFIPDFYQTLFRLTLDGNVEGLTEYISSFGYGAIGITIFMIVLTNMTGLPSIPFFNGQWCHIWSPAGYRYFLDRGSTGKYSGICHHADSAAG